MIVSRWQAPLVPGEKQITAMFEAEGLLPLRETFEPGQKVEDHRHPFDEVRMVVGGEMMMSVAGNKLLLRSGDKIIIPSNTKHSMEAHGTETCLCIISKKPS